MHADALVLCRGTISAAAFVERVAAARAGGFGGISIFAADYRRARADGLDDADMRGLLADNGLEIGELDPLMNFIPGLPGAERGPGEEAEFHAIADAIGARSINVALAAPGEVAIDRIAEAFAAVCDRAREHGLLAHLEFLPWTCVADLPGAAEIVRRAGRENGGIMFDTWHHMRSGLADDVLAQVDCSRVVAIQINDAPRKAEPDVVVETLRRRLLPGEGDIDLPGLLTRLRSGGCEAPIGVEIFSEELEKLPPSEAARRAGDATRRVLAACAASPV
jgi:sugar phosphate isomerase/epimerase